MKSARKNSFLFNRTEEYVESFMKKEFSAVITKGEIAYTALCPELGVVSQGNTEKEAMANLSEAIELYLEDEDVAKMLSK